MEACQAVKRFPRNQRFILEYNNRRFCKVKKWLFIQIFDYKYSKCERAVKGYRCFPLGVHAEADTFDCTIFPLSQ